MAVSIRRLRTFAAAPTIPKLSAVGAEWKALDDYDTKVEEDNRAAFEKQRVEREKDAASALVRKPPRCVRRPRMSLDAIEEEGRQDNARGHLPEEATVERFDKDPREVRIEDVLLNRRAPGKASAEAVGVALRHMGNAYLACGSNPDAWTSIYLAMQYLAGNLPLPSEERRDKKREVKAAEACLKKMSEDAEAKRLEEVREAAVIVEMEEKAARKKQTRYEQKKASREKIRKNAVREKGLKAVKDKVADDSWLRRYKARMSTI